MPKETLDEREFELVNIIGAKLGSNQRDLSRLMDLSLGMVNMLIKRMISKGYIRINQLDQRKVEYILTPKGFTEKMRKSVQYTLKTINSIGLIRNQLKELLSDVVQNGHKKFIILGESDFSILVEMVIKELCKDDYQIKHVLDMPKNVNGSFLLVCREIKDLGPQFNNKNSINLVEELAKDYAHINGVNGGVL